MATITTPQDLIRHWAKLCKSDGKIDRNISLVFEDADTYALLECNDLQLRLEIAIGNEIFDFMISCKEKGLIEMTPNAPCYGQPYRMVQHLCSFTSLDSIDELFVLVNHI